MIQGCLRWQRVGLAPPSAVIEATEEYLESEDTFGSFINEHCVVDANGEVSSTELFKLLKDYAENNLVFVGSIKHFNGWMAEHNFKKGRDKRTGDQRVFKGLSLRPDKVGYSQTASGFLRELFDGKCRLSKRSIMKAAKQRNFTPADLNQAATMLGIRRGKTSWTFSFKNQASRSTMRVGRF